MAGPGFGAIPWGAGPWGDGALLSVTFAEAIAENAVRVRFSAAVLLMNSGDFDDGLTIDNYAIAPLTFGARAVTVADVTRDGAALDSVIVWIDRDMSGAEARYDARDARVKSGAGDMLDPGAAFFAFLGCARFREAAVPSTAITRRGDVANPQTERDRPGVTEEQLGTIPVDERGDYALETGLANVRKRVLRRLMTPKGAFYHLPEYGIGLTARVKRLMSIVELRDLQADAEKQIRNEPDVERAEVRLSKEPHILRLSFRVRTRFGDDAFEHLEPTGAP